MGLEIQEESNGSRGQIKTFKELYGVKNASQLYEAVRNFIDESNYGNEWTLSKLIQNNDIPSAFALQVLQGTKTNGEQYEGGPRCFGKRYRLRVVTRQACARDADGKRINGWDPLPDDGTSFDEPASRPGWKDAPLEGDIIRVKGNSRTKDPDTGDALTKVSRSTLEHRGYELHYYTEYKVDSDGCISVPFEHAMQLLTTKGVRIAQPQFKKKNRVTDDGKYKDQRQITNWHFQEVADDYKAQRRQGKRQG